MDANYLRKEVEKDMTDGHIEEAIEKAIDISRAKGYPILNPLISLRGKLTEMNNRNMRGSVSQEDYAVFRTKLSNDFLNLIDNYQNENIRNEEGKKEIFTTRNFLIAGGVFLGLLLLIFSNQKNSVSIQGDNNDNNVVIGDNNVITLKEDKKAGKENVSFAVSVDNDFLNFTWKERAYEDMPDYREEYKNFKEPQGEKLTYDVSLEKGVLGIYPKLNYIDLFRKHGPITEKYDVSDGDGIYFSVQYPNLDFRLVNNSDETVFFERAEFRVIESIIDPEPLVVMRDIEDLAFSFHKESWGELFDCYVTYDIYPIDVTKFDYKSEKFNQKVSGINKDWFVTLKVIEDLKKTGFDFPKFRRSGEILKMEKLEQRIESMGIYKPNKILLVDDFEHESFYFNYYNQLQVAGRLHFPIRIEMGK